MLIIPRSRVNFSHVTFSSFISFLKADIEDRRREGGGGGGGGGGIKFAIFTTNICLKFYHIM